MTKSLVEIAKHHRDADMLVAGLYAKQNGTFKGCSIGCMLHDIYPEKSANEVEGLSGKHRRVAEYGGYPEWLALLQDKVFEGLPSDQRGDWHVSLYEAIEALPDGADWQAILHRVHLGILRLSYETAGSAADAVQGVIDLHKKALAGENLTDDDWSAAESAAWSAASAAWSAARSAAWSAARSAAWSAARSAAESAESAARSAARSAAESAESAARSAAWSAELAAWSAASAAESAAYERIRDVVLEALAVERKL